MRILITNDDGYTAKGLKTLAGIMKHYGDVTVVAPKYHQSGMSMAVSLGAKRLAFKNLGIEDGISWNYLDATPASCVKFGIGVLMADNLPDIVVSGINHGSNAASASCYSGTLGAAEEAALNGIPAIGVSLNAFGQDLDFSCVEAWFGKIFEHLCTHKADRFGIYYNINFPAVAPDEIKGIRVAHQGMGHWIKEFAPWSEKIDSHLGFSKEAYGCSEQPDIDEGEELYTMVGDFVDDELNDERSDHRLVENNYISIVAHNLDTTDMTETERLASIGIESV